MIFEGLRGVNSFGDIAIDTIDIRRYDNAVAEPAPNASGLPFFCDFEVSSVLIHCTTYLTND